MIKTRFAPSPTGFLHIGGARTALFSWAFARNKGGQFVLRIEDTDLERSTDEATAAILEAMAWLGLDYDEGPFYQTKRFARYQEVIQKMLAEGSAYYCYTSKAELEQLRQEQEKNKEKPRYDGRWRPEKGKILPPIPKDIQPVVRFKNPQEGVVSWVDAVKGKIEIQNHELDDLIIARADGSPTYNFCVVVDDWDMGITHVIRGDDHVNNTPRQINILQALGAPVPQYAHLSMILGDDGTKLSKRHGAVSVMQYQEEGFLPEAILNYLARLGWSHGDDEIFSKTDFVRWFDLRNITPSAAQFNTEKLKWVNQHYIQQKSIDDLQELLRSFVKEKGFLKEAEENEVLYKNLISLYKERVQTLKELADEICPFFQSIPWNQDLLKEFDLNAAKPAFLQLKEEFSALNDWQKENIHSVLKKVLKENKLKMPFLAMPLRVALLGKKHTPSVDIVLEYLGQEKTIHAIEGLLNA